MNTLLHIPTPLLLVVLASVVIPAVSAAVTRLHWDSSITGIITALLSTATGFVTEWANAGAGFQWKAAAVTALASWLVAVATQSKILSGTALEARLLLLGSKRAIEGGEPDPTVNVDPTLAAGPAAADPAAVLAAAGVSGAAAPGLVAADQPQTPPVPEQPAQPAPATPTA